MIELSSRYAPSKIEGAWYKIWEEGKYFSADETSSNKPYSIVIPPPNITGILHIGHALNNTIQDILIRWHRMKGLEALWMPGTDHAGIATQNVVEKKLAKEGKTRHQMGREKFVEEVWKWREQYGSTIINQLKRLGSSCDWNRTRFTMDEGLSRAVREVFVRLFDEGLIFKGKRIINWCPRCETALSDEESVPKESKGNLWYIKYPVKESTEFIIVATTRPETMLGDTGVAVNPKDERYLNLIGKKVILPLVNREIPVFSDPLIDMKFGTGAVKVTPAHDPADFEMGQNHNLEKIQIMDTKGIMNENVPTNYRGLDRFKCRKKVVEDLNNLGLLEKIEDYTHNVGKCYRCDTVIEPYLSDQWFVKMKPLAESAIKAVEEDNICFYPERWKKVYLDWMYNIRDWCISRQIWWGHRIPVWYCNDCGEVFASKTDAVKCRKCSSTNIKQDEDVLDTWFSSWLWPFSTMGWPENTPLLNKFYPTDTLVTAPEILFFWVARMIMAGFYCMGKKPFSNVVIHGTVRDETGRKMSKSLGNSIDPVSVIEEFGTDALRFSLIMITAQGQDVFLSKNKFELGRNFANKLWNASRLILSHLDEKESAEIKIDEKNLLLEDKWILAAYNTCVNNVNKALSTFRFNEAAHHIYNFTWHDFCDWYLEIIKSRLNSQNNDASTITAKRACRKILEGILRLIHPIMPFISEEIWSYINNSKVTGNFLIKSPYPQVDANFIDEDVIKDFNLIRDVIGAIRNIRGENNVPLDKEADVCIKSDDERIINVVNAQEQYFKQLAKVKSIKAGKDIAKPLFCGSAVITNAEIYVELEGIIDKNIEKKRLEKEITRMEGLLSGIEKKLSNKDFIENAPQNVIEKENDKKKNFSSQLEKLQSNLKVLG